MNGNEKICIDKDTILIENSTESSRFIMHKGEISLMGKLAEMATKNGGDILEIGFGLHLSADAVQSNPSVTSHTIIEIHPEIYETALEWAKDKPNVKILFGDWIDVLPSLNKKFDGILHDTHLDPNIPKFLDYVKQNCKTGTVVAFFEYNILDLRLNGVRFKIDEDLLDSLPYKNNIYFSTKEIELKYTTFDGNNFYAEKKQNNKLI